MLKRILFFLNALLHAIYCSSNFDISKNTWLPRSFVSYQLHDLMQLEYSFQPIDNVYKKNHVSLSSFSQYMQSFGGGCAPSKKNLGAMPFWSGSNQMTVGRNDGAADVDAYQFGLGNVVVDPKTGIGGTIKLDPKVLHFGSDILLCYLHTYKDHRIYFKLHLPLGAMTIEPHLTEPFPAKSNNELSFKQMTLAVPGNPSTEITYQFNDYPTPLRRPQTMSEAWVGGICNGKSMRGNVFSPLRLYKGLIAAQKYTVIRLGDIALSVGGSVVDNASGFFGLAGKFSFPTGNVPTAHVMLEPIFGRAGAWGVGVECSGLYSIWENETKKHRCTVSCQAELLHLFQGRTPNFRSFDLKQNGPGSKYLLIQNYASTYSDINSGVDRFEQIAAQYIEQAVNRTTLPVFSRIPVEGSVGLMLDFRCDRKHFSIGCEFWGRSAEKLSIDFPTVINLQLQNLNDFAVIGRQLSAYDIDGHGVIKTDFCEPRAKINKSQDPVTLVGSAPIKIPSQLPEGIADATLPQNRIPADVTQALDICGAQASRALTGKIFCSIGYSGVACKKIAAKKGHSCIHESVVVGSDQIDIESMVKPTLNETMQSFIDVRTQLDVDKKNMINALKIDEAITELEQKVFELQSQLAVVEDVIMPVKCIPTIALTAGVECTNVRNNAVQLWSLGLHISLNF